jgi:hypothetical protein
LEREGKDGATALMVELSNEGSMKLLGVKAVWEGAI